MRAVEFLEENLVLRRRCLNDELSCDGREFIGLQDLIFFYQENSPRGWVELGIQL